MSQIKSQLACLAARSISSLEVSGAPYAIFDAIVPLRRDQNDNGTHFSYGRKGRHLTSNKIGSCGTMLMIDRHLSTLNSRISKSETPGVEQFAQIVL